MAPGDKVEVSQQQFGKIVWIYARVIAVHGDGSAVVQINHPSNRDHGAQQIFTADQIRTKAVVQQILATNDRSEFNRSFRDRDDREFARHCQAQIDRLG
jgi:hypothetical protein